MKVGVLIPTYNREKYLAEALGSVLKQTFSDLEVVVIDNASNDGTAEFMKGIADPRVRYIVNDRNIEMIGSINKGIRLFSSEVAWCTVLSDDDLLDAGFIASMVDFVGAHAVKAIAHSHRTFIDADGKKLRDAVQAPLVESSLEYVHSRSVFKRETFLTGIFFSRSAFEEIGGYPTFTTGTATDDAFIFALSLRDNNLYHNSHAVVLVRLHPEAESHSALDAIRHFQALKEYKDYVEHAAANANKYGPEELTRLDRDLDTHIEQLNNVLLVRNIHALLDKKKGDYRIQREELFDTIENKEFAFSTIFRWYVFLLKTFDVIPGVNKIIMSCVKTIIKIRHQLTRR